MFVLQEQSITCRGGLAWWKEFIIVPCYNIHSSTDEVHMDLGVYVKCKMKV